MKSPWYVGHNPSECILFNDWFYISFQMSLKCVMITSSNGNIFRVQLLAICAGNSPVSGEFPAQRPVTRSFDIFVDLYGWVNNRGAGDLRRYRAHYDVTVMFLRFQLTLVQATSRRWNRRQAMRSLADLVQSRVKCPVADHALQPTTLYIETLVTGIVNVKNTICYSSPPGFTRRAGRPNNDGWVLYNNKTFSGSTADQILVLVISVSARKYIDNGFDHSCCLKHWDAGIYSTYETFVR